MIYPTALDESILELTHKLKDRDLTWEVLTDGMQHVPKPLQDKLTRLVEQHKCSLTNKDREQYKGYLPVLKPPPAETDEGIARVKLAHDISDALQRLGFEEYLRMRKTQVKSPAKLRGLPVSFDREGLLDISAFDRLADALVYKATVFFLDPHIPFDLQTILLKLDHEQQPVRIRVALSGYFTSRDSYAQQLFEAREWGRPFKDTELSQFIKDRSALSVYARYPKTEREALLLKLRRPICRLEALRTEKPDCLSFMFEELVPIPSNVDRLGFINTFLFHAEYDRKEKVFRHSDGTLLIYSSNSYQKRIEVNLADKLKAEEHFKLFRIDGRLGFGEWSLILQRFFYQNELILEFLSGK
ncbi:MAG: hypothetical protein KAW02_04500 [candidate division Zixibacteria bacterium]|nr:hypothetical protein [candidate division Zixibacteria bacterium]